MLSLRACLLAAALTLATTSAFAVPVLDQEHDNTGMGVGTSTNGNVAEVGQTFTVGIAGTLDRIDVLMFRLGGIFDPTGDPILSVYNTSAGLPTGAPLISVSVPEATVPFDNEAFIAFDVSSANLAVNVGDVLAWGIRTTSEVGPYWILNDGDIGLPEDYTAGVGVRRFPPGDWSAMSPASDHGFRSWVTPVPEPSTVALLAIGLIGLAATDRFRRKRNG